MASESDSTGMELVHESIPLQRVAEVADATFGDLVKAVVDVRREVMVIGGELHADEEALLLSEGADQSDLWGINLYPAERGQGEWIEYDSMINVRPSQSNRSRSVEDPALRERIAAIVDRLVT